MNLQNSITNRIYKPALLAFLNMKISTLLLRVAIISMVAFSPFHITSAEESEPVDSISDVDIAYWARLQQELLELRTANLRAGIRVVPLSSTAPILTAVVERLENFLDRRDADPVDELSEGFLAYRELIVQLADLALTPTLDAAQFHARTETSGTERMRLMLTNLRGVDVVNQIKPRLMLMHQDLNAKVRAAGGPSIPFFQVLGIGDTPQQPGQLDDPAVRDARFLEDVKAINPHLGALIQPMFLDRRDELGVAPAQAMEMFMDAVEDMRGRAEGASLDEIRSVIFTQPEKRDDGSVNIVHYLLRLALLDKENRVGYQLNIQEFQGAYARWIGESDALAPMGTPLNVAVSRDGSWFSYAEDANTLITRRIDGELIHRLETREEIRSFDIIMDGQLHYFTTRGVYSVRPTAETPAPGLEAERQNRFIQPLMAAARDMNRSVFAIGVMPGIVTGLSENTFTSAQPGSRISAVGISADGTRVVYGYAGDRFLPQGHVTTGFQVLIFDEEIIDQSKEIVSWPGSPFLTGAVTAIGVNTNGSMVAAAVHGPYGGNVFASFNNDGQISHKSISIDNQHYTWLQVIEEETTLVVAGTASGLVRVWEVPSMELKLALEVPAGPEGVGYALVGGDLLSVAAGSPSIHRWRLSDGKHLATLLGETPDQDLDAIAERSKEESELRAIVQPLLITAIRGAEDERLPAIEALQTKNADEVQKLGLTETVRYVYFQRRYTIISNQYRSRNYAEAYTMARALINEGFSDERLIHLASEAGFNDIRYGRKNNGMYPEVIAIATEGLELHPNDISLQRVLHELKAYYLMENGRIEAALAEVDALGMVEPSKAPHGELRQYILETGQLKAADAGNNRMAGRYLLQSLQYESDLNRKINLAENAFAYANRAQDWQTALEAATIALQLKPSLQNDSTFMHWARHAYQQVNR